MNIRGRRSVGILFLQEEEQTLVESEGWSRRRFLISAEDNPGSKACSASSVVFTERESKRDDAGKTKMDPGTINLNADGTGTKRKLEIVGTRGAVPM